MDTDVHTEWWVEYCEDPTGPSDVWWTNQRCPTLERARDLLVFTRESRPNSLHRVRCVTTIRVLHDDVDC